MKSHYFGSGFLAQIRNPGAEKLRLSLFEFFVAPAYLIIPMSSLLVLQPETRPEDIGADFFEGRPRLAEIDDQRSPEFLQGFDGGDLGALGHVNVGSDTPRYAAPCGEGKACAGSTLR